MQLGTENRKKTILAMVLGVAAILVAAYEFMPSSSTSASAPVPNVAATSASHNATHAGKAAKKLSAGDNLDPTLHLDELTAIEQIKYEGSGRNIFVSQAEEIPKPLAAGVTDKNKAAAEIYTPPPTPAPTPIPLKFFGFANKPGEPRKVFLVAGEDVFVAAEGEIVDRRYKVLRISPTTVEMQDVVSSGPPQTLQLTQG